MAVDDACKSETCLACDAFINGIYCLNDCARGSKDADDTHISDRRKGGLAAWLGVVGDVHGPAAIAAKGSNRKFEGGSLIDWKNRISSDASAPQKGEIFGAT